MKAVNRNQTIGMRYSLDKMEKLILSDIARLEAQLDAIERDVAGSSTRVTTAGTYRKMISDRKALLDQIQFQSQAFQAG